MKYLSLKNYLLIILFIAFTFSAISCKGKGKGSGSRDKADTQSIDYQLPDLTQTESHSDYESSPDYGNYESPASEVRYNLYPDFFPEDGDTFYIYDGNDWEWSFEGIGYTSILPDYCQLHKDADKITAITLYECPFVVIPEEMNADERYPIVELPAGAELELARTAGYGITVNRLYPVYLATVYLAETDSMVTGYIRGDDITDTDTITYVDDGKGGYLTLYYQRILRSPSKYEIVTPSKYDIEEYLNNWFTYEMAGLQDGYYTSCCTFVDSFNNHYKLDIEDDGWITLEYPLNMKNPIPFVVISSFNGGMGGGLFKTKIYTLEIFDYKPLLEFLCEYEVCDTDGGPTGTAYHYFTSDSIRTYVYQEDGGQVEQDMLDVWIQDPEKPYSFSRVRDTSDFADGNNTIKTIAQYCNPTIPLKVRSEPDKYSTELYTLAPGSLVIVREEGPVVWIDGYYCNWVKVEKVNNYSGSPEGWVFGGYLE